MHETPEDLHRLQQLLDSSFATAGKHLSGIFEEKHRLKAEQLVERLPGIFEMHLAVVTSDGRPLVAPIDAQFFKGNVWFGLPAGSVRDPLVRRRPEVSASYTAASFLLIVHGTARAIDESSELGQEYSEFVKECYVAQYGKGWLVWHEQLKEKTPPGESFTGWIEPRKLFAKDGQG